MNSISKYIKVIDLFEANTNIYKLNKNVKAFYDSYNDRYVYSLQIPNEPITISTTDKKNKSIEVIATPTVSKMIPEGDVMVFFVAYTLQNNENVLKKVLGQAINNIVSPTIKERLINTGFSQEAVDDYIKNIKSTGINFSRNQECYFAVNSTSAVLKEELMHVLEYAKVMGDT